MKPSHAFDPELHIPGSPAAEGRCAHHLQHGQQDRCAGEAVVSYQDAADQWQSGCSVALEELVERAEIEPLGQGA